MPIALLLPCHLALYSTAAFCPLPLGNFPTLEKIPPILALTHQTAERTIPNNNLLNLAESPPPRTHSRGERDRQQQARRGHRTDIHRHARICRHTRCRCRPAATHTTSLEMIHETMALPAAGLGSPAREGSPRLLARRRPPPE